MKLQVVDVQRYPRDPKPTEMSRFYVAASDSESLIWLVILPQTQIEDSVSHFQLDIGCVITVVDFILMAAVNGRTLVVPLHLSFTPNAVALIGSPVYDTKLFSLSPKALLNCTPQSEDLTTRMLASMKSVSLEQIKDQLECTLSLWKIVLKFIQIGELRSRGSGSREMSIRCVGMDQVGCLTIDRSEDAVDRIGKSRAEGRPGEGSSD